MMIGGVVRRGFARLMIFSSRLEAGYRQALALIDDEYREEEGIDLVVKYVLIVIRSSGGSLWLS